MHEHLELVLTQTTSTMKLIFGIETGQLHVTLVVVQIRDTVLGFQGTVMSANFWASHGKTKLDVKM